MVNSTNLGLDNSKRIVGEEPKRKDEITATASKCIQFIKSQELPNALREARKE